MIAWHNDTFLSENEKQFSVQERLLRYGDGFFESMIAENACPLWVLEHYSRIVASAEILKLQLPKSFTQDYLTQILRELLQKNGLQNARFRAVIYRKGAGLYNPQTNEAGIFITCSENAPTNNLPVIEKMTVYTENRKAAGNLANIKSCNSLLFVMASLFAKENDAQEAVILSSDNTVCEAVSANIFIVKNGKIKTPSLQVGCVAGVMRPLLIHALKAEETVITLDDLYEAETVFLSNISKGIQAVQAIDEKIYATEPVKHYYEIYRKMRQNAAN